MLFGVLSAKNSRQHCQMVTICINSLVLSYSFAVILSTGHCLRHTQLWTLDVCDVRGSVAIETARKLYSNVGLRNAKRERLSTTCDHVFLIANTVLFFAPNRVRDFPVCERAAVK